MVYRTLIESKMDYATFLCPSSADALHVFDWLLHRFFQCCLLPMFPGNKSAAIADPPLHF